MTTAKPDKICQCSGAPIPVLHSSGSYVMFYKCFKCAGLKIGGFIYGPPIYDTANKP